MSQLQKYEVVVFGASTDPVSENKKFAEQNKYNFVLLSDPEKGFAKSLGVLNPANGFAKRWTYVIDKEGKIAAIDMGVKVDSHGKDVAALLDQLKVPKKQ